MNKEAPARSAHGACDLWHRGLWDSLCMNLRNLPLLSFVQLWVKVLINIYRHVVMILLTDCRMTLWQVTKLKSSHDTIVEPGLQWFISMAKVWKTSSGSPSCSLRSSPHPPQHDHLSLIITVSSLFKLFIQWFYVPFLMKLFHFFFI